jgi:hypothetical protein
MAPLGHFVKFRESARKIVISVQFRLIGPGNREEIGIMRIWHPDDSVEVTWHRRQELSDHPPRKTRKTIPSRI